MEYFKEKALIEEGQVYKHTFQFTQADVVDFARVTGDDNPIHLDEEYAAQTSFKQPIMHGFLSGAAFSKVLGKFFPGQGTIYVSQTMKFLRPMYVEYPYVTVFTVLNVNRKRHRAILKTEILDKVTEKVMLTGEAEVMHPEKI
ncbi:MAG: MaoC family dehydratase [Thermonemataceae bacterium]